MEFKYIWRETRRFRELNYTYINTSYIESNSNCFANRLGCEAVLSLAVFWLVMMLCVLQVAAAKAEAAHNRRHYRAAMLELSEIKKDLQAKDDLVKVLQNEAHKLQYVHLFDRTI